MCRQHTYENKAEVEAEDESLALQNYRYQVSLIKLADEELGAKEHT